MKKIDYRKLLKEASRLKVPVYLLIKRRMKFRKCRNKELDCRFCEHIVFMDKKNDLIQKYCCQIIGVSLEASACVSKENICDLFKKQSKGEKHDYERYSDHFNLFSIKEKKDEK